MDWPIGLMSRMFTNSPGDRVFNPKSSHTKDSKMVLDTALLNTQQYKVRIRGKMDPGNGVMSSPTTQCCSY